MNTAKRLAFAVALTLLTGLFWSTQAQSLSTKLQTIEVSPGIEGTDKGMMYGATYLGKTTGVLPGSFFLSMNYDMTSVLTARLSLAQQVPSIQNITGGTWSLPVYRGSLYLGAIYGHIQEGTMQGTPGGLRPSTVNMILVVDGGTQTYDGTSGSGTFSGTLNHVTKDGIPTMSGTLSFDLSNKRTF